MLGLYIEVFQIPACMLLLVQLPPRNHLCLMEFLIVCPEFEKLTKLKQLEIFSCAVGRRQKKVLHLFCLTLEILRMFFFKWLQWCSVQREQWSSVQREQQQQCSEFAEAWVEDMAGIFGLLPKTVECCCYVCVCFYIKAVEFGDFQGSLAPPTLCLTSKERFFIFAN